MPAPSGGFISGVLLSPDDRGEFYAAAIPDPALAPVKRRVLLVEDDPSFREILHGFLTENGCDVVTARNGAEGVNAVMSCDFTLILCDLMMPKVPGEAFYRAVERVRPHLCARFVFMTGYRNDATAIGFIQRINGYILQKPFELKDLLDAMALAEVRGTFESVFDSEAGAAGRPEVFPRVDPDLAKVTPLGRPARVADEAPASAHPSPAEPSGPPAPAVAEASEPARRVRPFSLPFAFAALALLLCVCLGASLVGRVQEARKRAEAATAERAALEAEWKIISPQLEQAEKARGGFASLPKRTNSIAEERNARGWTGVLRVASINAGPEIDLRSVTARCAAGACELRIDGTATGAAPRAIADEFCQAQRRELESSFPGAVVAQFEKLEEEPESSDLSSSQHRARFTLKVSVELRAPPKLEGATAK